MAKTDEQIVSGHDRTQILTYKKCVARVMLDQNHTWKEIEQITGLSTYAISRVAKGEYDFPPGMMAALRSRRGQTWEAIASMAQEAIMEKLLDPEQLKKINPLQLATVAGIAEDKAKMLEEPARSPTEGELGELSYSEIVERVNKLRKAAVDQFDEEGGVEIEEATVVVPSPLPLEAKQADEPKGDNQPD